jgi:purine-binding chemotaxis protein CheW
MASEIVDGLQSYFTFRIGNELMAVNIGHLAKILEMTPITPVPNSPAYFKGILNLFGDVLPIYDGRLKFGYPEMKYVKTTCILIVVFQLAGEVISAGIVVDSVEKIVRIEPEQIKTAFQSDKKFNPDYIDGIAHLNDETIILLNLEKIFSEEEITLINKVK